MLRDRKDFVKLADPRLKGQFPANSVRRAVDVAIMCAQINSHARPCISEVVQALDYLASQKYTPNAAVHDDNSINESGRLNAETSQRDTGPFSSVNGSSEGIQKDIEMTNKALERKRAVAEAKMWGETWREKRQLFLPSEYDLSSR